MPNETGMTFPTECAIGTAMSPAERVVEFALFDGGACVTPIACTPKTCAALGTTCGPAADGCGNVVQCGACATGLNCVAGACVTP